MIHLTVRIRCPKCMYVANVCVHPKDKVEADYKLSPQYTHDFVCPSHGGPMRIRGTIFRLAETCPEGASHTSIEVEPDLAPQPAKRPWWQFWGTARSENGFKHQRAARDRRDGSVRRFVRAAVPR